MHADWFFQQHRYTGRQTIKRRADVLVIRIGDDDCVWLDLIKHLTVIGEMSDTPVSRKSGGLRPGIRHCAQCGFAEGLQVPVMLLTHIASADQGDSKGRIQGAILF
jgi:hypothetical protein